MYRRDGRRDTTKVRKQIKWVNPKSQIKAQYGELTILALPSRFVNRRLGVTGGPAILSRVGFRNDLLATMLTSFGSATITFLSDPNLKLSAMTFSSYRLIVYGSFRWARIFRRLHVTINGPVAVIIDVSAESTPVLNRAGVNDIGCPVSCWNCATCAG